MAAILDDIAELERKIARLLADSYEPHPGEILEVCKATLALLRQVAERQEQPR